MSTNKHIDKICCVILAFTVLISIFAVGFGAFDDLSKVTTGYELKLFDDSYVHTIEIVMDDWDGFLETCENEEYASCSVIIDNESYKNVAIRAKGNTSLSSVSRYGNNRYSFKIEFDHYDTSTYHGLDKLSLNNLIQDNTYMKDYLVYTLMRKQGVAAPLCSFVKIVVNGENFGVYLAVEGVEDSFLQRNYGADFGKLYKPDSMNMGGGRGNGKDFSENAKPDRNNMANGSSDVLLKYIDDSYDSYANIFDNAKTDITNADKDRLISSIKTLNEGTDVGACVDVEAVIKYFVVHNFVCNFDSYTGQMIHNYYLYEKDGVMSMLPWDYNLAFGGFMSGSSAQSLVNFPIDSPVSGGNAEERPMIAWIFNNEEYTELYHKYMSEFTTDVFDSGYFIEKFTAVYEALRPYVENDPTAFCTYDEFVAGAKALKSFCELRAESVKKQLDGTIPSTSEGQAQDSSSLVKADELNINDMGSMGMGGNGGFGAGNGGFDRFNKEAVIDDSQSETAPKNQTDDSFASSDNDFTNLSTNSLPFFYSVVEGVSDSLAQAEGFFGVGGQPQGEMPQMPDGNFPQGELPQMPDGNFPQGEMPQMPDGNFPQGEMPQMPDGNFPQGEMPQMPDGNFSQGEMLQIPEEETQQNNVTQDESQQNTSGEKINGRGDSFQPDLSTDNQPAESFVSIIISFVVLVNGLIFAKKFRRYKN